MSSCRCDEMTELNRKIGILNNGKNKLNEFDAYRRLTDSELVTVANNTEKATLSEYVEQNSSDIKKLYTQMNDARSLMNLGINLKISYYQDEYSRLHDEDEEFHREEREAEEQAAQEALLY